MATERLPVASQKSSTKAISFKTAIIVLNKPPGMPVQTSCLNFKQDGIGIKWSLDELAAAFLCFGYSEPPTAGYTWLELSPLTGRKHQLSGTLCLLGTPIVGESKYGWQAHRRWQSLPD
ncbi:hypothetical protein DITRI_Ditri01bG0068300 [Diplodiscus trichospermus]